MTPAEKKALRAICAKRGKSELKAFFALVRAHNDRALLAAAAPSRTRPQSGAKSGAKARAQSRAKAGGLKTGAKSTLKAPAKAHAQFPAQTPAQASAQSRVQTRSRSKTRAKKRDPLARDLEAMLRPILGPASEKASLLVEHLAKTHSRTLAFEPRGVADAVRRLRLGFTDAQIRAGGESLMAEMTALYSARETVV